MSRIKKFKPGQPKKEEKKSRKAAILTLILAGTMLISTFAIMLSSFDSGNEKYTYNDYKFQRMNNGWITVIDGKTATFSYLPDDIKSINISTDVKTKLSAKAVYITFNPNSRNIQEMELLRFELGQDMYNLFAKIPVSGITEPNDIYNQPIITCENATASMPVISIEESNTTRVFTEGDCVRIETDRYSSEAVEDKIVYSLLGIE